MRDDVELRDVRAADMSAHFEQQRDAASNRMAGVPARDRAAFDAHWERLLSDPEVTARTIVVEGEVAGSALSFVRDGQREVGYWIGRERWGQGIATAALAQLLELVSERPLFARTTPDNAGSLRVLQRCGFHRTVETVDGGSGVVFLRLD
jgi:RimJ/RimL family protein N-acetyltransferase